MQKATQNTATAERRRTLKDKMLILSRRDRMGRAMPTWYRVLAAVLVLLGVLLWASQGRKRALLERQAAPELPPEGTIRLTFTGDLMLSRGVEAFGEELGYATLFKGVSPLWAGSDLVFSGLDGVVLTDPAVCTPAKTAETLYPVTPEALSAAIDAGINAFSAANAHSMDYGSAGLAQSLLALEDRGAAYAGAGADLPTAGLYRVLEAGGLRVGFVACSAVNPNGPGPIDDYCLTTTAYSALYRNVLLASDETDLVVVYVCWGEPGALSVSQSQRNVAHQLIQSGADIVIGTHPQVVQPVERYRDGWIFYSLGSLTADSIQRPERESVLARLELDPATGEGGFTLIPLVLKDFSPEAASSDYYRTQIQRSLLKELPEGSYTVTEDGRVIFPIS